MSDRTDVNMLKGALAVLALTGAVMLIPSQRGDPPTATVRVIDGDTIAIGDERIRLNGIDAPELHGCRRGRRCVEGDGQASKDALTALLAQPGRIEVNRLKTDRYGRTVAQVRIGDADVSCLMVARGAAAYIARWDEGGIMEGSCE